MSDLCRICLEDQSEGRLICPCQCKGSIQYVHVHCLEQWRRSSANPRSFYQCDQCCYHYSFRRTMISTLLEHTYVKCTLTVLCFLLLSITIGAILWVTNVIPVQFPSAIDTMMYYTLMGSVIIGAIGISILLAANLSILHGINITLSSQHSVTKFYAVLMFILGTCHVLYRIYQLITYIIEEYASRTENLVEIY